jgi:hypothetical protein
MRQNAGKIAGPRIGDPVLRKQTLDESHSWALHMHLGGDQMSAPRFEFPPIGTMAFACRERATHRVELG